MMGEAKLVSQATFASTAFATSLLIFVFLFSMLSTIPASATALSAESSGSLSGSPQGGKQAVILLSSPPRAKRSREMQQLCGYRLLDALRSVCDRNFVGYTRRSDPSLLLQPNGQSGEELNGASVGSGMGTWDSLTMEYPQLSSQPAPQGAESGSLTWDDVEYMQGSPLGAISNPFSMWPRSNKAFALKMLAEPVKTHQRFRRNIIDECCKKPCAMNQMLKYCAGAAGKRSLAF